MRVGDKDGRVLGRESDLTKGGDEDGRGLG